MFHVLDRFPGLFWTDNGQSVLSGPLLQLARRLDATFLELAETWSAEEYQFPAFLSATELQHKLNYLGTFPHQVTFPIKLAPDEANLDRFARNVLGPDDAVALTEVAPVRDILTPATCAHAYVYLQHRSFTAPYYLTCRNTCYRNEASNAPLQRQWVFTMREIVCLGTAEEVRAFLDRSQEMISELAVDLKLPIDWVRVSDPFFKPSEDPLDPTREQLALVKHEAVFDGSLAIASSNFHHDHFGTAFSIIRAGRPVYSGCIAFGLERWLYAIATQYGPDHQAWPQLGS